MMKFMLFIACLSTFGAYSQNLWLLGDQSITRSPRALLHVEGGGAYRSNVFNNQMIDRIGFGGKLDEENIRNLEDDLREMNRIGGDAYAQFRLFTLDDSLFNKPNLGLLIQGGYRRNAWSYFSRDAYRLGFIGNEMFRGAHADLDGNEYESITYQKLGVGFFDKQTKSYISGNFVIGQQFSDIQLQEADLFTSTLGDSLHVNYQGSWYRSDTAYSGLGIGNGVGFSLDGAWNVPLSDKKGFLTLEISDFGMIFWGEETLKSETDTSFAFIGWEVQDILDDVNNIGFLSLEDTLGYSTNRNRHQSWLPTTVDVSLKRRNTPKDFFEVGVRIRPNQIGFIPELYGSYGYFTNPSTLLSVNFRYGGYGRLRFGASLEKWMGKTWYLGIATDDIPGFILNRLKGRGLQIQIGKTIGKRQI